MPMQNEGFVPVKINSLSIFASKCEESGDNGNDLIWEAVNRINETGISRQELKIYDVLCRDYARAMCEQKGLMKRSQLKKLDTVDLRPLKAKNDKTFIWQIPNYPIKHSAEYLCYLKSFDKQKAFCNAIPPFENLVYRINEGRWFHVRTVEVDPQNYSVCYEIQDYVLHENNTYAPGTWSKVKFTFNNNLTSDLRVLDARSNYLQNLQIDGTSLGWNQTECQIWHTINEVHCKASEQKFVDQGTSEGENLAHFAIMATGITNFMLHGNKPVIDRKTFPDRPAIATKTKTVLEPAKPVERRIRTVGALKITSSKMPRETTMETVRHYKTAVWHARGGIRHMKDGRIVPFKESIRTRKALRDTITQEQLDELTKTTIRLKDNRPNKLDGKR